MFFRKTDLVFFFTKLIAKLRPFKRSKIFGIGLPKTGTKTLGRCFKTLGYKHHSCDMDLADMVKRNELSRVLNVAERFETFEDWPWFLIYKELDQRFPNSKFILTLRKDTETYISSLKKHHIRRRIKNRDFDKLAWWDEVYGFAPDMWDYRRSVERYEKHTREVMEYFKDRPKDLLIVCWENGDGWSEFCHFLNMRCPNRPFPHQNASPIGMTV